MTAATKRLALLAALLLAAAAAAGPAALADRNVRFGLPAPAKADPADREAYLIERAQYTLSYNAKLRRPNWVCWQLDAKDLGHAQRGAFVPDPLLPRNFPHVPSAAYSGGGFDRGHMCPAQDRSATQKGMDATFYTTNIVPQSPACNQKAWERLQSYCRDLAHEGKTLYIACGPAGVGGVGRDGPRDEIGKGHADIAVPAKVWKVVLVLPSGDAEPRKNSRVIAVIMPNDQTVDFDWAKYRVRAKDVEKLTGYKFFRGVADAEVADALRDHLDEVKVREPHHREGGRKR
jgi:endonuclease G, mitochondrial